MTIRRVDEGSLSDAAEVHAVAWRESHREICSPEFVALHTAERQERMLRGEMERGAQLYLLEDGRPAGVVTVRGDRIANLYVLPERQNRGYGTMLLRFAVERCSGRPTLWVLSSNFRAQALYARSGFRLTGKSAPLKNGFSELEMIREEN